MDVSRGYYAINEQNVADELSESLLEGEETELLFNDMAATAT